MQVTPELDVVSAGQRKALSVMQVGEIVDILEVRLACTGQRRGRLEGGWVTLVSGRGNVLVSAQPKPSDPNSHSPREPNMGIGAVAWPSGQSGAASGPSSTIASGQSDTAGEDSPEKRRSVVPVARPARSSAPRHRRVKQAKPPAVASLRLFSPASRPTTPPLPAVAAQNDQQQAQQVGGGFDAAAAATTTPPEFTVQEFGRHYIVFCSSGSVYPMVRVYIG